VFRYFIGRNETLSAGPTLIAVHKACVEKEGRFKELADRLTFSSDAFLYRTSARGREVTQKEQERSE